MNARVVLLLGAVLSIWAPQVAQAQETEAPEADSARMHAVPAPGASNSDALAADGPACLDSNNLYGTKQPSGVWNLTYYGNSSCTQPVLMNGQATLFKLKLDATWQTLGTGPPFSGAFLFAESRGHSDFNPLGYYRAQYFVEKILPSNYIWVPSDTSAAVNCKGWGTSYISCAYQRFYAAT